MNYEKCNSFIHSITIQIRKRTEFLVKQGKELTVLAMRICLYTANVRSKKRKMVLFQLRRPNPNPFCLNGFKLPYIMRMKTLTDGTEKPSPEKYHWWETMLPSIVKLKIFDWLQEESLKQRREKHAKLRRLYNSLPCDSLDRGEFLPTQWLISWLSEDEKLGPIDNSLLLCEHGQLNPEKFREYKLVSSDTVIFSCQP